MLIVSGQWLVVSCSLTINNQQSIINVNLALANLWIFLVPPCAGAIIGYFTNDIAIKMLFRPYKPLYISKYRVPLTPGVIPRNQERLAQRIADTIMGSLLTPSELQKLAKRLLELERVQSAILWLLQLALSKIQGDKQEKTAAILADILRDLLGKSLPRLLKVLSRKEGFLADQVNQIFDRILLEFKLTEEQARQVTDWLLESVLSPEVLRQGLVDFLTERNVQVIDEGFREKTSGTYWVVANLFGVRNSLTRLRHFCIDEPEIANTRLKEILLSLEIRNRIKQWLMELSLQNLPVATVRQLRTTTRETVQNYLQDKGAIFLESLGETVNWHNIAIIILNRLKASDAFNTSLEVISQELALILDRYLEEDLEQIIAKIIPILAIDEVIVERVKDTSPQQLEANIQGIVRTELQAIVNLGGLLGFMVGLLQVVILLWK